MNKLLQAVAAKTYQLCRTYPGGIRAMFAGMRERHGLSESSVYADLNPNNGQSTLRVWELVRVMEATGEHGPLRELANWFGYSLVINGMKTSGKKRDNLGSIGKSFRRGCNSIAESATKKEGNQPSFFVGG